MNFNILLFLSSITAIAAIKKTYAGYKLYNLKPFVDIHVEILNYVQNNGIGEVWEEYVTVGREVRIMVSKEHQEEFIRLLSTARIEMKETVSDLQKLIEDQLIPASSRDASESFHSMTWDRYYTLDEIYNWLDVLESEYPNIIEITTWGHSVEGRELKGIIINHNPNRQNPVGVLESTIHAREWIAPATITWIIKEFLTSTDPDIKFLAESYRWHILPVANPDGYVYTFTDNRMWRKNRNVRYNKTCVGADDDMSNGVDLNRNFGHNWMEIGASNDSCTNTFAGSGPNSEPETVAIVNYIQNLQSSPASSATYYLAFHSYTQLIVIPPSHVNSIEELFSSGLANKYSDLYEIGIRAASKLEQRFRTPYRVGIAGEVLYPMSGTSFDYMSAEMDIPVCYLIELRDLGEYGFLLPPEQIIPNNLEIMDFLVQMDKSTRDLRMVVYGSGAMPVYYYSVLVILLYSLIFVLLL